MTGGDNGVQLHELADLFPPMSSEEYAALKASIETDSYDPAIQTAVHRGQ